MAWIAILLVSASAWATEYHGQVFVGAVPVPGATVTVSQDGKQFSTVTDEQGLYAFPNLADGTWKIEIRMRGFATLKSTVTVAPNAPQGKFELTLLSLEQMLSQTKVLRPAPRRIRSWRNARQKQPRCRRRQRTRMSRPPTDCWSTAATTIAMEIDNFQLNRAEYYVPIIVKIPGRELALAKKFGAEHTLIDFVCEVKDATTGMTMSNVRDYVDIKLNDQTIAQLAHRPVEYDSGFTLFPGKYSIKFLARDDETGRIGTYQTYFTIPDLNKLSGKVALSSVVLGSQRVDLNDALYNAQRGKEQAKDDAANPLVHNGLKLIPSVTRVFKINRPMYVFLQAYERDKAGVTNAVVSPAGSSPTLLFAYVSFYRDQKLALEMPPVAVMPEPATRLGVAPFHFTVPLGKLTQGAYQCQVSVLDPAGHRAAFWRGPVMLAP